MADFDQRAAAARMMALQEGGGVPVGLAGLGSPPWGSGMELAPGAEVRNYVPSWLDSARRALDWLGGNVYPDLGQRTEQTASLLSIPAMLAPFGAPARAAATAGSGPAWDAAMARVLHRKYPDGKAVTGGGQLSNHNWFVNNVGDAVWDSSSGLKHANPISRASTPPNPIRRDPWSETIEVNDLAPAGDGLFRYLNEVLAQNARARLTTVP